MRCRRVREELIDSTGHRSAQLNEHLEQCPACRVYARDRQLVSMGFRALAEESMPEASLGFSDRVARQLLDPSSERRFVDQSLVGVGRRFVYAGLLATLLLLLGLLLPSSGPLRGPTTPEPYIAQPETATVWNDPLFSEDVQANQGVGLVRSTLHSR